MRGHEQLQRRLRSRGLCLIEPDDQDGRLCQYLAIIHQLNLNNAPALQATRNAYALESETLEWFEAHAQDITGIDTVRGDEAWLSLLRDSWTDIDVRALHQRTAWGDHNSLAAVLSMLGERGISAQAYVYDSPAPLNPDPFLATHTCHLSSDSADLVWL